MHLYQSDQTRENDFIISRDTVKKWQSIVDHIAGTGDVAAVLIMRLHEDDGYIEVFRASSNQENPFREGDRMQYRHGSDLLCEEVITSQKMLLVPDIPGDDRFRETPAVAKGMVSYLGVPVIKPDGMPFGTLCIFDSKINYFDPFIEESMNLLRDLLEAHLALLAGQKKDKTIRFMEAITENIPNAYVSIINNDMTVGFTTGGEFRRLNLSPALFEGKSLEEIFGDNTSFVKENYRRAFNGEEVTFEMSINDQHQMYRAVPLMSEDGAVESIMAFAWNITARKKAEDALRYALELNHLIDKASAKELMDFGLEEGVRLTGSRLGYFHFYNIEKKVIELQTWSSETLKGCSADGSGMQYPLADAGIWADCIRTGKPVTVNDYNGMPDKKGLPEGHVPVSRFMSIPIYDKGNIVAIVGVGNKENDYTEDDRNILTLLADNLWNVVQRKRTEEEKDFVQLQLIQAQKMEAVGNLAGGLAHDFNNVLNAMSGSLEILQMLLQKEGLTQGEKIEKYLETARTSFHRARDIISQLLTLSKKQEQKLTAVDVNIALKHIMTIARNSFPKSIRLDFNFTDSPVYIHADPTQMEQAFLNIAVNASHAMTIMRVGDYERDGLLSVHVEELNADEDFCMFHPEAMKDKTYAVISFVDNGVGMDENMKRRIFEPFYSTKGEKGTGLGLSMVYSIVKMHKGFIDVYSEPGSGTRMSVYVPVYTVEEVRAGEIKNRQTIIEGTGTVLLIDDEKEMILVAEEFLRQCGYTVLTAPGALEGIDVFRERRDDIDAVILDLSMPVKSGLEVYRELNRIDPSVRVLLSSGFSQDERIDRILAEGARGFIAKPYSRNELSLKLREIIG